MGKAREATSLIASSIAKRVFSTEKDNIVISMRNLLHIAVGNFR